MQTTTQEKEAAIEAMEFERAAGVRDKERRLQRRLRLRQDVPIVGQEISAGGRPPWTSRVEEAIPFLLGWLLFGVALGVGILVGWLIWG